MEDTHLAGWCPQCGAQVPADAALQLCPACLLAGGTGTISQGPEDEALTVLSAQESSQHAAAGMPRLEPGQRFGPYQIGRLLGRGGMGEVYEAEHPDTGRRLALKILRGRLHDAEDRARFLREGQLAASVSHPHTVYIFGSEEISGLPVISMELLPGGTLRDRVAAEGPLPPAAAVTAVLDIIGGLDAAQAAGILHRDIKPSNCFTDHDGSVKVGDFGLSISTLARDVFAGTGAGGFEGTPQFAAPEQLRGEPLDLRADIYAVGATLYYLLTGAPPFEANDLGELVGKVTKDPPPSPRARRPDIPRPVAAIVQQCLAKDPQARPASYAALAERLRPFSAAAHIPAAPGARLMAGIVDALIIAVPFSLAAASRVKPPPPSGYSVSIDPLAPWAVLAGLLYYAVQEGLWSASLGKRLFGLRVTGAGGPASWQQILVRTAAFYVNTLPSLVAVLIFGADRSVTFLSTHLLLAVMFSLAPLVGQAAIFSTMRRQNGYAAFHDLLSGTRVVMRPRAVQRVALGNAGDPSAKEGTRPLMRCGPFDVMRDLGETESGRLLAAFDPALRRQVWIRVVPTDTPALGEKRRDLGRGGRLHWLTGRRSAAENWDAFEAPGGEPLLARRPRSGTWAAVKTWLLDLSAELAESARDETLPALGLDRVWIRGDGRAVLLDFPAPGVAQRPERSGRSGHASDNDAAVRLLGAVALYALDGVAADEKRPDGPASIPLGAAALLRGWTHGTSASIDDAHAALVTAAASPDRVLLARRAIPIAMAAFPIVLALAASVAVVPALRAITSSERFEMYQLLAALPDPDRPTAKPLPPERARDIEIYLAGRHGALLTDPRSWPGGRSELARLKQVAARLAAAHPSVSADELQQASESLTRERTALANAYAGSKDRLRAAEMTMIASLLALGAGVSFVCCLVSAVIWRGGLITRLAGLVVVTRHGAPISRRFAFLRALVAWSPVIALVLWLGRSPIDRLTRLSVSPLLPIGAVLVILAAGAAWTIVRRTRGPHDDIAGTWVVPR